MTTPPRIDLHPSLSDPVLSSVGFLNEVMAQYPEAISFAPGAPYLRHLDTIELDAYVRRGADYLGRERGLDVAGTRRLMMEYGPSRGLINGLIAKGLASDFDVQVDARAVVVTVGAQEALLLALRALTGPDRDVLGVVTPTFPGILGAARLLDVDVHCLRDRGDILLHDGAGALAGPDIDEARAACAARPRMRTLYVAPDYANPSGGRMSLDARHALLELADAEDLVLIEDNAYGFTAGDGDELPPLWALRPDRVVLVGTFSKICLPGARVGFAVAQQPLHDHVDPNAVLADALAAAKTMVTVNTAPLCQALVAGLLLEAGGSLRAVGVMHAEHYRANLARLVEELDTQLAPRLPAGAGVTWNRPAGGFFVLMELPVLVDLPQLDRCAREHGVIWTPMAEFYPGGGGERRLRLSCSYLTPEQLTEGVRRLTDFVLAAIYAEADVNIATTPSPAAVRREFR